MIPSSKTTKILVLGASGMLGNAVLRIFSENKNFEVFGTLRSPNLVAHFPPAIQPNLIPEVDVQNLDNLLEVLRKVEPSVVINCIGLVKQHSDAEDPLSAIPINALLPHRLAQICKTRGSRLIHMSTDCIFSGQKGMYTESDFSDANDLYGRSKFLGEVDYPNAITLRTSIIGHELQGARSLIGWFLSQSGSIKGYTNAIFSGLPTVEIAHLIRDYVIPNPKLHGVYHISADPISKYDLLRLVAEVYQKDIAIDKDNSLVIDRSLDSSRFRSITGFQPKPWLQLVKLMKDFG